MVRETLCQPTSHTDSIVNERKSWLAVLLHNADTGITRIRMPLQEVGEGLRNQSIEYIHHLEAVMIEVEV
jgi:hypothetical protein